MGEDLKPLETALEFATREFSRLVLNISDVARLDSTGIGLIVRYAANLRKRSGDVRLADPPAFIVTLLNLANLSSYLRIYPTEEDAILSFLQQQSLDKAPVKPGPRVVIVDQSPDLCAFVRTVLSQHGFDVQSTYSYRDARIMLKVQAADVIIVGPGTGQLSNDYVVKSLQAAAPRAKTLPLGEGFCDRDAHDATEVLLRLIGVSGTA
jgi:anti-anti-sigma factor